MSFGWSLGDILTCIEIIYECGIALRASGGSPDDRMHAKEFLGTFSHTITVVQQIYGPNLPTTPGGQPQIQDDKVPPPTEAELLSLNALKVLYDQIKTEITKYAGMNRLPDEEEKNWFRRQTQKLKWHFFAKKSIQDLKSKITDQVLMLQPALSNRQFQGAAVRAQSYHEEYLTNFDDLKTMIRLIVNNQIASSQQLPSSFPLPPGTLPADPSNLSRASTLLPSPDDYTAYTTASQQLAPYLPPPNPPSTISSSLHRLRVTRKLHLALKTWLMVLDSSSPSSNILWLQDHPTSTHISAIVFSVLTSQSRPILSFSASHIDRANPATDIPPATLLIHTIYTFLHTLLEYLDTHASKVRQRIDTPLFSSLDGTLPSLSSAITLLGNLLDNLPCPAIFVIDNAQFLDKPALQPQLAEFYALFARRTDRVGARYEGAHKLLVTSKGGSAGLSDLGMKKGLTRVGTQGEVVNSGGYVVWEEVLLGVRGWKIPEEEEVEKRVGGGLGGGN